MNDKNKLTRREEQDKIICAMLIALRGGPMRRVDLLRAAIIATRVEPSRFNTLLKFCIRNEYVKRVKIGEHIGYKLIEKGERFINAAAKIQSQK